MLRFNRYSKQANKIVRSTANNHVAVLSTFKMSFIGAFFGIFTVLALSLSGPAPSVSAAACTSDQKTTATYALQFGTGQIIQTLSGYYTVPASGRTEASCKEYGATSVTFSQLSQTSNKFSGGSTCGTFQDTITLTETPTDKNGKLDGKIQVVTGSGGKNDPCRLTDPTRYPTNISVTIKATSDPNSGGNLCANNGQHFSAYINSGKITQITEALCAQGILTTHFYKVTSDNPLAFDTRTYTESTRGKGYECTSNGYNGRLTLRKTPSDSDTSVKADLEIYTAGAVSQGFTSCDPSRSSTETVTIKRFDTTEAGEYSEIAGIYSMRVCESLGITAAQETYYDNCLNDRGDDFIQFIADCKPSDSTSREDQINCLISKAPEVEAELRALLSASGEGASTCAIEGVGWIVCPVVNFLAGLADGAFGFLADSFLRTDPEFLNTDKPTYQAWSVMRTIANVAFVIVFLIIIFSQLTGLGVSNYGVKKMLPRIVIAAILVNVSFFICQLAVDLSNILGYSIKDVFGAVGASVGGENITSGGVSPIATGEGFMGVAGGILAAVGLGLAGYALLSTLIPVLLAAVVALVMILFILVARQALIILLIVISPLAFVAFLLPNTEGLFKKWRQALTSMLLLFPIIAVVFGASSLASGILSTTFTGGLSGEASNWFGQLIAAAVMVLPLFVVPLLLKKSLDSIPMIGNALNNFSSRAGKGLGGAYKGSAFNKYREGLKADNKARISAGNYAGRNPLSRVRSRLNSTLNTNRAFNTATGGYGANRDLAAQAQDRKDRQDAIAMFGGDDDLVAAWAATGGDMGAAKLWKNREGNSLKAPQLAQMERMRAAGHHRKATSFLAAVQSMSESGKGNASTVSSALAHARSAGASETVISGANEAAKAAYRASGRGDILASLSGKSAVDGWKEVAAEKVHREAIDASNPTARANFVSYLDSDREYVSKALAGFDKMEGRAQELSRGLIVGAAQRRAITEGVTTPITTIQEAKDYFGIK